jgi:hypothetical protein
LFLFQSFFRDHRPIDFSDSHRELRVQQELKWSSDEPSIRRHNNKDDDPFNGSTPILAGRKFSKANFLLKGDPQLGSVLMYSPAKAGGGVQQHSSKVTKQNKA